MKFTIIKSCLARFSGIFAVGTPSNIHGTAISYRCAKFGAFVNSVTILTLRDLTINLIYRQEGEGVDIQWNLSFGTPLFKGNTSIQGTQSYKVPEKFSHKLSICYPC